MLENQEKKLNYNIEIQLNSKKIKARKWKAKEKFIFKANISSKNGADKIVDSLVYDCLETEEVLSTEEYKYALLKIREASISDSIKLQFNCAKCNNRFNADVKLSDILKPVYIEKDEIKTQNHVIKIGEIKNKEFYKKVINQSPNELDFYLRIESINGEECVSISDVIQYFSEMDIDEFEKITEQWEEIRFKLDDNVKIVCPNCQSETVYKFDEIPGFFPNSWYVE